MAARLHAPQLACRSDLDGSNRAHIAVRGELDLSTVSALRHDVDEMLDRGAASIVVDLSRLTFVDSSGLHALLAFAERARREDFSLELVEGPADVMRVFELTRTLQVLPFRASA